VIFSTYFWQEIGKMRPSHSHKQSALRKKRSHSTPYNRVDYDVEARNAEQEREREIACESTCSEFEFDEEGFGYPMQLEEFDPEDMPSDFFIVLEGRRRIGKSFWARWFLWHYQYTFGKVICFTNTKMNKFWSEIIGDKFVHEGWDPWKMQRILDDQRARIDDHGKPDENTAYYHEDRVLVILDDIISDKKNIHDDQTIENLATAGRHFAIAVLIMTQAPKAISTKLRDNTDLAVIFNQRSARQKEAMHEDFVNTMDKYDAQNMVDAYTQDHAFLAVRTIELENDPKKLYKKGKAVEVPDFIMGGPEQRKIIEEEKAKAKQKSRLKAPRTISDRKVQKRAPPIPQQHGRQSGTSDARSYGPGAGRSARGGH
jgi:hypothetical protein